MCNYLNVHLSVYSYFFAAQLVYLRLDGFLPRNFGLFQLDYLFCELIKNRNILFSCNVASLQLYLSGAGAGKTVGANHHHIFAFVLLN